jgi:hypothetical protein
MKVIRVASCLSVLLLSLLAFVFTLSTSTTHAQGPIPCTPVANGNGSQTCTVNLRTPSRHSTSGHHRPAS